MKTVTKHYIHGAFVESHGREATNSIGAASPLPSVRSPVSPGRRRIDLLARPRQTIVPHSSPLTLFIFPMPVKLTNCIAEGGAPFAAPIFQPLTTSEKPILVNKVSCFIAAKGVK
jgi:hypothetical protein